MSPISPISPTSLIPLIAMSNTFIFDWNIVTNIIMALGTLGLFGLAIRRQRSDVRIITDPVSREHCEQVHLASNARVKALEHQVADFKTERHSDIGELHAKINAVDRRLAGIETATELQNQQLARMDTKLDRMNERA